MQSTTRRILRAHNTGHRRMRGMSWRHPWLVCLLWRWGDRLQRCFPDCVCLEDTHMYWWGSFNAHRGFKRHRKLSRRLTDQANCRNLMHLAFTSSIAGELLLGTTQCDCMGKVNYRVDDNQRIDVWDCLAFILWPSKYEQKGYDREIVSTWQIYIAGQYVSLCSFSWSQTIAMYSSARRRSDKFGAHLGPSERPCKLPAKASCPWQCRKASLCGM